MAENHPSPRRSTAYSETARAPRLVAASTASAFRLWRCTAGDAGSASTARLSSASSTSTSEGSSRRPYTPERGGADDCSGAIGMWTAMILLVARTETTTATRPTTVNAAS